eukprot:TRINITY_DN3075_c0_g1_i1.p1 TRINITY_DN3075_c0_g1~~TRINITY_DN3075_c0_g1_i1.p1  ORF type:complete len:411 (-),score=49.90 TRINITY_DN3075_c0_g1_i1:37-1269(-)
MSGPLPGTMMDVVGVDGDDDSDEEVVLRAQGGHQEGSGMYAWEKTFERSWDTVHENEDGELQDIEAYAADLRRRRALLLRPQNATPVRRGMNRFLFVILDLSKSMDANDLTPSRLTVTVKCVEKFIREFFDQNPISQLGLIVTRNSRAEKVMDLCGNPRRLITSLRACASTSGEPSIQNALNVARSSLRYVPKYGSREILLVMSSLTTCDPGNLHATIDTLVGEHVRCSVVGLSAELHVCNALAQKTKGDYKVAMDADHLMEIFLSFTSPPPSTTRNLDACLIPMGFPPQKGWDKETICACHNRFVKSSYSCPQCKADNCDLPTECRVCGLTLILSTHLARSYHHLFPVAPFEEVNDEGVPAACYSCLDPIPAGASRFHCKECDEVFCFTCDCFVHEVLHNCPACCDAKQ